MNRRTGSILILALAVTAAGCSKIAPIYAPPNGAFTGGTADFSNYVAMGASLSAGFQSGGLVVTHQQRAFPVLFARQIGQSTFTLPSVSADGIPALLRIAGPAPWPGGILINNTGRATGAPVNIAQGTTYHDMGIPGALLTDAADTTLYYLNPSPIGRATTMFDIITRRRGSVLVQALRLQPTFVSLEYGMNEVLGPVTRGSGTPGVTPAQFAALYAGTLDALLAARPTVKLALFTVPDVTAIPYATYFKPDSLDAGGNRVRLLGPVDADHPDGRLLPADRVLLNASTALASGDGFPVGTVSYVSGAAGTGVALTDAMVLSASEAASVRAAIDGYNATIASQAALRGAALVDLYGLLKTFATQGYRFQGQTLTATYVTGGLYSLDGVHPNDLAHGILGNLMIDAVNAKFGSNIPRLDLNTLATGSSSAAIPARGEEPVRPSIEDSEATFARLFPWRP